MNTNANSEVQEHERPYVPAVVDRLEGDSAVVIVESTPSQELILKRTLLPHGVTAGTALRLVISSDAQEEAERVKLAKTILNELLQSESEHDTSDH